MALQCVAIVFAVLGVIALVNGAFDVFVVAALIAGGFWFVSVKLPQDSMERRDRNREKFREIREAAQPNAIARTLDKAEARRRGKQAAERIVAAVRDIEHRRGPFLTIRWNLGDARVNVWTDGASSSESFDLNEVTGFDLKDSTAMQGIMEEVAIELGGEHRPILGY